jgi:hypothetical protein
MMLHAFDGRVFHPHGLLQSLPIQLGGKTIIVDVEVVDAPLDYNLLLGRSWFYAMTIVASSVFRCVLFPHQGKIVIVDQLDLCTTDARAPATKNIPFMGDHKITYESIGVGLLKYSSLMGTFPTPLPPTTHHISTIDMISTAAYQSLESSDPWIVPSPLEFDALGDTVSLSLVETSYVYIQSTSPSLDDQRLLAPDSYSMSSRLSSLSSVIDYISPIFTLDESIMEMLSIDELPQDDNHHRSSFLPHREEIWEDIHSISPPDVDFPLSPMPSTSNDLDPVVDMAISSVGILEPNILTPIVTFDMCFFQSDFLPSSEDLLESITKFCPLTWCSSKMLFFWKP